MIWLTIFLSKLGLNNLTFWSEMNQLELINLFYNQKHPKPKLKAYLSLAQFSVHLLSPYIILNQVHHKYEIPRNGNKGKPLSRNSRRVIPQWPFERRTQFLILSHNKLHGISLPTWRRKIEQGRQYSQLSQSIQRKIL